jgi:hypothetical protein
MRPETSVITGLSANSGCFQKIESTFEKSSCSINTNLRKICRIWRKEENRPVENKPRNDVAALADFFEKKLPLNRKEVYYTATVLPGIICADGFKHFDRFLNLLGLENVGIQADPAKATNIQFFTEYNFSKTKPDAGLELSKFDGKHQQSDLLIFVEDSPPIVIVIEGKMYAEPTKDALTSQMESQEDEVRGELGPDFRLIHAAVVPGVVKRKLHPLEPCKYGHPRPIIAWEEVADSFDDVDNAAYFKGVLRFALEKYDKLNVQIEFHRFSDDIMTGSNIVKEYNRQNHEYQSMGRKGGLDGDDLLSDIATGKWRSQRYEVRKSTELPDKNSFPISEFVKRVTKVS